MKKRSSVDKANWSDTREEQYKKDCLDIVFKFGDILETINRTVYIIKKAQRIEITKPYNPKTFWYETWTKLREYYGV